MEKQPSEVAVTAKPFRLFLVITVASMKAGGVIGLMLGLFILNTFSEEVISFADVLIFSAGTAFFGFLLAPFFAFPLVVLATIYLYVIVKSGKDTQRHFILAGLLGSLSYAACLWALTSSELYLYFFFGGPIVGYLVWRERCFFINKLEPPLNG